MSKTRWLLSIPAIIVVVLILLGLFLYRYQRRVEPSLTIELSEYPNNVTAPTVTLSGHVSQPARIEVTRDSSFLGTLSSSYNFSFNVELEPGKNIIEFSARPNDSDSVRAGRVAIITWEPKNPPPPVINPLPATTNLPMVTVTGTTYPNGKVRITVAPDLSDVANSASGSANPTVPTKSQPPKPLPENAEAEAFIDENTTDKDGAFQVKVWLSKPGPYKVTAIAQNSLGKSSDASADVKFVYDPDWYQPSAPVESKTARRIIRKANIVLAHKQMTITLETTLPRDDPAVRSLLANHTKLDGFLEEIFGLQINGTHYSGEFDDIVPQIVLKDRDATITATTAPYRTIRDFLPLLHGELTIEGKSDFPFSSSDDSLSIRLNDYMIESISPPPTLYEKNTMTWAGSKPRSTDDRDFVGREGRQIKMQLSYRPFASPRNLLRLAQVIPTIFGNIRVA